MKPNVIVVFADQMRGMDMGCAGNKSICTSQLDQFAREGMMFTHAYANSPVCTPSRGTLLTGMYPLTHKAFVNDLPISSEVPSIATYLKAEGYRTGYIGKWHLDGIPREKFTPPGSRRLGFDDYWAVHNCSHHYFNSFYYEDSSEQVPIQGYEPEVQTDLAIQFIEQYDADQPFCLFLSWGPPHNPYNMVPKKYKEMYHPDEMPLRKNVNPAFEENRKRGGRDAHSSYKEVIANYYAAITALDDQFGRLMEALSNVGIADNTIVIFTSDHGDMLFSQESMFKQKPWEESINIPFLIRWPGHIPQGKASDALIGIVDVVPSLLGLTHSKKDKLQGTDLSTVMLGLENNLQDSVFIMNIVGSSEWRGVRTKRYTYACQTNRKDLFLYDNDLDPFQQENLIERSDYEDVLVELRLKLDHWLDKTEDHCLNGFEHIVEAGLAKTWDEIQKYKQNSLLKRMD